MEKYERKTTIKSEIDYKSDGTLTNPSGSVATVSVIKPDGTYLISGESATHSGTGEFYHYFDTSSSDPLGIYIVEWKATSENLGGTYGYKPITQRKYFNVVDTENP